MRHHGFYNMRKGERVIHMYTHAHTCILSMSDKMAHYEASMNSTAAFIQDRTG